jgi:hypothetical protein
MPWIKQPRRWRPVVRPAVLISCAYNGVRGVVIKHGSHYTAQVRRYQKVRSSVADRRQRFIGQRIRQGAELTPTPDLLQPAIYWFGDSGKAHAGFA